MRRRNYCFTINNPTKELPLLQNLNPGDFDIRFAVFQLERVTVLHLQGYVEFEKAFRITSLKRMPFFARAHLEPRYGTKKQAIDYCCKADSRVDGPWFIGDPCKQGRRTDLVDCRDSVINDGMNEHELLINFPTILARYPKFVKRCQNFAMKKKAIKLYQDNWKNRAVFVLVGPTGSGKTRMVYDTFKPEQIYRYTPVKSSKLWFDDYSGEPVILIDDYNGEIEYRLFLNLLDRYPMRVEVKGDFVWLNWEIIVITSNEMPTRWYDDEDSSPLLRRIDYFHLM